MIAIDLCLIYMNVVIGFLATQSATMGYRWQDEPATVYSWPKTEFSNGLGRISVDGKWGFIDAQGKVVIVPKFDNALSFSDGMAPVSVGRKWGLIDRAGRIIVMPQYNDYLIISEGLACVRIGGKFGFIDNSGKVLIEPRFDRQGVFSEGWANGLVDGQPVYIDHQGNIVLRPIVHEPGPFRNGLAVFYSVDGDHFGFIDRTGKVVIEAKYKPTSNWTPKGFSEGLALVQVNSKWGFIDKTGRFAIEPKFDFAMDYCEGLALVVTSAPNQYWDKVGFIDHKGNFAIEPQFDSAGIFSDGLAGVRMGEKKGYIDKSGNFVIVRDNNETLDNFSEGLAIIMQPDLSWGYINKDGRYVWEPTK